MNNILKLNDIKQTLKKEKNKQMYLKYKLKTYCLQNKYILQNKFSEILFKS